MNTTRVLVWQQYGNVQLFHADDIKNITESVVNAMTGWGEDTELNKMIGKVHGGMLDNCQRTCEQAILDAVRPHIDTHEVFERFEFLNIQPRKA